jgi:hypothetical protein
LVDQEVGDHHARVFLDFALDYGAADAARAAGYDGDFPLSFN